MRKEGTWNAGWHLVERPEMAAQFMAHPLPGQTLEDPSRIITLFPDTLIATRYSTLVIERQIPVSPDETVFETRHVFLKGDTPELKELRDQHWMLYWAQDPETCRRTGTPGRRNSAACRASACDIVCWRAASRPTTACAATTTASGASGRNGAGIWAMSPTRRRNEF